MGLQQDANRRLLAASRAWFAVTRRHQTRNHTNDKRTLVTHTLDDGRASRAGSTALVRTPFNTGSNVDVDQGPPSMKPGCAIWPSATPRSPGDGNKSCSDFAGAPSYHRRK